MATAEDDDAMQHDGRREDRYTGFWNLVVMHWRVAVAVAFAVPVTITVVLGGAWVFGVVHAEHDRPVAATSYQVTTNDHGGTDITIWVSTGSDDAFTLVQVGEETDRVEVAVRERVVSGSTVGTLASYSFTFPLDEPIGSRIVVDISNGRTLPQRSTTE